MPIRTLCCLILLAISSTLQAGSWWDDLESGSLRHPGLTEWITTDTVDADYLSTEYNRTLAAGSSASLVLASDGTNNAIGHYNPFSVATSGANSIYFYDDGADLAKFKLGVNMTYAGPEDSTLLSFLGVGANDTVEGANTEYVTHHDHVITSTGLTRSPGWHRLQVSWIGEKNPRLMLDGVLMSDEKSTTHTYTISSGPSFHAEALPVSGATITTGTKVWLDDLLGTRNIVPESFLETYEPGWDTTYWNDFDRYFGAAETTSALNHTPGPLPSSSIARRSGEENQEARAIALPHNRGYVSAWFYDDGTSPTEFSIYVTGALPEDVSGQQSFSIALGVRDESTTSSNGYLLLKSDETTATVVPTGVARTTGWHKLDFGTYAEGPGLKVRLDDEEMPGNIMSDAGTISYFGMAGVMFDTYRLGDPVESAGWVYLDDVSYFYNEDLPDLPSSVENWRAFE